MEARAVFAFIGVFVGCCSNVVFLELIIKIDPGAGNLVTFLQFSFISLVGFCTVGKFGTGRRIIPLKDYVLLVCAVWCTSVANNYAFNFNIAMPLHMIFRSGSLMANMVLGILILKRNYTFMKHLSVVTITAGIIICTIESGNHVKDIRKPNNEEQPIDEDVELRWWCVGIAILTFAVFMSARLGIFQEMLYAKHGKHSWEALYYTHFLPLPVFALLTPNLIEHARIAVNTPLIDVLQIGTYPIQIIWLLLYCLTQYVCIGSVYVLTTECTSLTVTLTITLRKFASLLFSIFYFSNPFTLNLWIGSFLVFAGTLIFTESLTSVYKAIIKPNSNHQIKTIP